MESKRSNQPPRILPVAGLNRLLQQSPLRKPEQTLNCVSCRLIITTSKERIEISGNHRHTFVNPHGYSFTIGCFSHADGVAAEGEPVSFWSWFPGYQWQIVLCRQCTLHLGWRFSGASDFYGLILNRLISVDLN
jgi:hypothetical protein